MSPLPIELGVLDARHAHALAVHLLALDADDRYARFGYCLPDAAIVAWVRRIDWLRDRWIGAWCGPDAMLAGALQLAPTRCPGTWELALTVASPARRQGVGTRLLATALCDPALSMCRRLICHHGHPAVTAIAQRLGLSLSTGGGEPALVLQGLPWRAS